MKNGILHNSLLKLFTNMLIDSITTKIELMKIQKVLLAKLELSQEERQEVLMSMNKISKTVDKQLDIVKAQAKK